MPFAERPTRSRYGHKWHDGKAPDGFTVNGWRRVTKDGSVRFSGDKHYHEQLKEWAGMWVFVELSDWLGINVEVWPGMPWRQEDFLKVLYCKNEKAWRAATDTVNPNRGEKA